MPPVLVPPKTTGERLFNLIQGAFKALNETQPAITNQGWLCLRAEPPYYEGIAVYGSPNYTEDANACDWNRATCLTLAEISGTGTCVGMVPVTHHHLCNDSYQTTQTNGYLKPGLAAWWACSSGLTPCLSLAIFNSS